ncbi:hypothetical protein D3C71_1851900 [compost metagenome]
MLDLDAMDIATQIGTRVAQQPYGQAVEIAVSRALLALFEHAIDVQTRRGVVNYQGVQL